MSELEHLSEKITRLADMARTLQSENAALKRHLKLLQSDHDQLARRSHEAQQRIATLLEKFPQIIIDPEQP